MINKVIRARVSLTVLFLGAFVMLMSSVSLAVELRLTDDARTSSATLAQRDQNFGTNANLRVHSTANSYIKFDFSTLPSGTVGSDIAKASLKLWADSLTAAGSFEVRRVTGAWTEEGITWNTAPPLGGVDGTGTAGEIFSFIVVDVTQLVKDWLDGVQVNHGLALVALGSTDVTFDSKEDPQRGHEPQLEIVLAGDITSVTAGTGLTGGGTKGDVTLNVDTAQIQKRVVGTCTPGSSIREIDATGNVVCEIDDNSGGTVTSVGTGSGLTGGPITTTGTISVATGGITGAMIADGTIGFADVNPAQVQVRVSGTCSAGNAIRVVNENGTVTCQQAIDGSGASGYIAKFTGSTTVGNSVIYESGGNVGVGMVPGTKLDIIGPNTDPLDTAVGTLGINGRLLFGVNSTAGHAWVQTFAGFPLRVNLLGNNVTFGGSVGIGTETPTSRLHVIGDITASGAKNFQIDHPLEPNKELLVHSAIEGPEVGVYYRGEAQLDNSEVSIILPIYFEALTRKEQRTVQLTPIGGWAPLYVVDGVRDGGFTVRAASEGNPTQRFYWEVKAVRADVPTLIVEKLKTEANMKLAENLIGSR